MLPSLDWRTTKDEARKVVHDHFALPCQYYAVGATAPVAVSARVHDDWGIAGDLTGTNFRFAELAEKFTTLIFYRSDVPNLARDDVVVTERGEGYRIEVVEPRDGITVTARVRRLTAAEQAALP